VHEWALAEAVIEAVRGEARKKDDQRVLRVVVEVGELQTIDPEVFSSGLEALVGETPLEAARFEMIVGKARFRCNACGAEWGFDDVPLGEDEQEAVHFIPEVVRSFAACPGCSGRDYDVVDGRGVSIVSIAFAGDES
jgi:hydrogenase nickel incorporation protein HypA/HybF